MVEVQISEQGTFEFLYDKWDIFLSLLALGFSIAVVIAVIAAGARLGWKAWPWILGAGLVAWLLF